MKVGKAGQTGNIGYLTINSGSIIEKPRYSHNTAKVSRHACI